MCSSDLVKTAMRERDAATTSTLRMILAALKDRDIAARPKGITTGIGDDEIATMLQGMIKQRRESIEMYQKGNRADLVDKESAEITVIERYLPKQMTDQEIHDTIGALLKETGATAMKDMGRVMAALKERHAGKMDFGKASGLVKGLLQG